MAGLKWWGSEAMNYTSESRRSYHLRHVGQCRALFLQRPARLSVYALAAAISARKFSRPAPFISTRAAFQANVPIQCCPSETSHTFPAGYTGSAVLSACGRGCGSESKIRGFASVQLAPPNRSVRCRCRSYGTSMGHLLFLCSCFQPLKLSSGYANRCSKSNWATV
jgi:hypothetical protein